MISPLISHNRIFRYLIDIRIKYDVISNIVKIYQVVESTISMIDSIDTQMPAI